MLYTIAYDPRLLKYMGLAFMEQLKQLKRVDIKDEKKNYFA